MYKYFLSLTITSLLLCSCESARKGDKATITEEQETAEARGENYQVDAVESNIHFTGYGVGKNHQGKFRISSGMVSIKNNKITGGKFTIDIAGMEVVDKGEIFQTKLKPHLLSGDFFDAENFKTAKFEITNVEPYETNSSDTSIIEGANFNVSGNLTLKDVTKNITFPTRIDLDDKTLKGKANFNIDRTQWKINYGNDKTLGDKFISETVNIKLNIKALRQLDEITGN